MGPSLNRVACLRMFLTASDSFFSDIGVRKIYLLELFFSKADGQSYLFDSNRSRKISVEEFSSKFAG